MYTHSEDLFITAMFLKRYRGRTEEGLGSAIKFKELKNEGKEWNLPVSNVLMSEYPRPLISRVFT